SIKRLQDRRDGDHTTRRWTRRRSGGRCETRSRPAAACVSDFPRLRGGDPAPRAIPIPSASARSAARSTSRCSCRTALRVLGCDIPGGHGRTGRKPTTTIVRTGPYRFSRNPIYLAFSLLQLGIAIWVNSVWLLATLVAAVALMHFVVIPKEE